MLVRRATLLVLTALAPFACRRDRVGGASTTNVTSAPMLVDAVDVPTALERLVATRCNRDQLCAEMGITGPSRTSRCASEVEGALGDTLRTECPQGVGREPLDACIAALREAPCAAVLAASALPEPCRTSELCTLGALAQ